MKNINNKVIILDLKNPKLAHFIVNPIPDKATTEDFQMVQFCILELLQSDKNDKEQTMFTLLTKYSAIRKRCYRNLFSLYPDLGKLKREVEYAMLTIRTMVGLGEDGKPVWGNVYKLRQKRNDPVDWANYLEELRCFHFNISQLLSSNHFLKDCELFVQLHSSKLLEPEYTWVVETFSLSEFLKSDKDEKSRKKSNEKNESFVIF